LDADFTSNIIRITGVRKNLAKRPSAGPSKTIILPDETHDLGFAMTSSFSTMLLTALAIFDADTDYHNHVTKLVETFNMVLPQFIEISKITPARIVYIGTGPLGFAAREAALKSLELTAGHIPSMWETTLGFRHGPKSFVCPETMIVLFKTPSGHCRAYEDDLFSEIKIQFPNNPLFEIDLAKTPCTALTENTAWLAPIMILLAQVQSVHWSNGLGLNVDNPFDGRGTLSRVVSGVRLHEVQQWSQ
jgi:tagatose-6-phosphate ketose/aldose isomerase